MHKRDKTGSNWPKYLLQWGVLAAIIFFMSGLAASLFPKMEPADPERFCPAGGLEAFTTYVSQGSLPCSMTSLQVLMGLALAAAVILFSKLFCAFICPIGSVEDLLTRLRKSLKINGIEVKEGGVADKLLRLIKYALLFWIFYMTATSSELFCKNLDPYYAAATGFKGEITLWMSLVTLGLVIIPGFFIKRFWCRYICPIGAASNTLKFWLPIALLALVWWGLTALGLNLQWWWLLAAFCLAGYLLEVFSGKPRLQLLHINVDGDKCGKTCHSCQKACPYNIDLAGLDGKLISVDCVLCGECVAACPHKAVSVGKPKGSGFKKFLPALLTILLFVAAILVGKRYELPTIDESWDITDSTRIETLTIENLKSVKCFSSSMAFKARMESVRGVHGVKTFVGSHTVVIKYDPDKVTPEKIQEEVFTPSHFRIWSPDPKKLSELKIKTIRTEKMYDKLDLNYLGLQFRTTGKSIFGIDSEYDCPLIVHVYMSPDEDLDEEWFREVVNRKVLEMPVHGGGVKETPIDIEFVRLEEGEARIGIKEYLEQMFDPFTAEYSGKYPAGDTVQVIKRTEVYEGEPQFYYEIAEQSYEKPIIKRALPYLSNHLSKEEGVIGMYLCLNSELVPCIRIRYAAPMTPERIWELMTMENWTITYKPDDVRVEPARMKFDKEGVVIPYAPEN